MFSFNDDPDPEYVQCKAAAKALYDVGEHVKARQVMGLYWRITAWRGARRALLSQGAEIMADYNELKEDLEVALFAKEIEEELGKDAKW